MRLFIALTLPAPVIRRLVSLQAGLRVGRPVPPENMHLTLAFLGERREDALDAIGEAFEDLPLAPFEIALAGVETLGAGETSVLAAGVRPSDPLAALESRLTARLRGAGLDLPRRRFRPHVTIARGLTAADAPKLANALAAAPPFATDPFAPEALALFRSRLGKPVPVYEELGSLELDRT